MKPSKPHHSILWLFAMGLLGPVIACERDQPAESPQPTTSAQAYNGQPTGYPPGAYPQPTATAYAQPTATTAVAPTAAPAATTPPPATATATPPPPATTTATATATPPATATLPSFPTLPVPNFQFPSPQILSQILPTVPLDPKLLQQLQQAGQQLLQRGTALLNPGDPTDAGLKTAAVKYAPLMVPEGAPYKDTLMANSHKAFDVTLQGNKCYTIIAYSPPGQVTNIDLHLLVPPFYNMDAGHDDSNDSTAVIGKGQAPLCPFTLIPIPYRVDVYAKAGQGQVAVQVYSKNK
jgi:hypothetical protein